MPRLHYPCAHRLLLPSRFVLRLEEIPNILLTSCGLLPPACCLVVARHFRLFSVPLHASHPPDAAVLSALPIIAYSLSMVSLLTSTDSPLLRWCSTSPQLARIRGRTTTRTGSPPGPRAPRLSTTPSPFVVTSSSICRSLCNAAAAANVANDLASAARIGSMSTVVCSQSSRMCALSNCSPPHVHTTYSGRRSRV